MYGHVSIAARFCALTAFIKRRKTSDISVANIVLRETYFGQNMITKVCTCLSCTMCIIFGTMLDVDRLSDLPKWIVRNRVQLKAFRTVLGLIFNGCFVINKMIKMFQNLVRMSQQWLNIYSVQLLWFSSPLFEHNCIKSSKIVRMGVFHLYQDDLVHFACVTLL